MKTLSQLRADWHKTGRCYSCGRKMSGKPPADKRRRYCSRCRGNRWKAAMQWMKKHPERQKELTRRVREKLRKEVFDHYGNQCNCCGENYPACLVIDHVNGRGTRHIL